MDAKRPGRILAATFILGGLAFGSTGPANAATVTLCGSSICYEYDDAQAAIALFGAPTLVGDALRFLPSEFLASVVSSASPVDLTTATFIIDRAYSVGGEALASVTVTELGDYMIRGAGEVSADLSVLVANNDIADFVTGTGSASAAGDSGGLQSWDLTAAATLTGGASIFNDAAISLQNLLVALIGPNSGDFSFTQKKMILVEVNAVPLPATVWLMLTGVLALGGRRVWRRTRS